MQPVGSTPPGSGRIVTSIDLLGGGVITSGNVEVRDITDLAAESLTNPNLTAGASWTQTGDFALAANAATYTHAAGTGTFEQTSAAAAIPWATLGMNSWYVFTYTTSAVTGAPTCTLTTSFALASTSLSTAAGTYTVTFQAKATTLASFVVQCTSGAAATITFDTLSLKRVVGGDIIVNGQALAEMTQTTGTVTPGYAFIGAIGTGMGTETASTVRFFASNATIWNMQSGVLFSAATDTATLGATTVPMQGVYATRFTQGSKSKALTETVATTFVTVACPQTASANFCAGRVIYTVYETDATDMSTIQGTAQFNCVNKAGTESCSAISDVQTASLVTGAGDTLACTITAVTGLADVIGLAADCTDGATMVQTTLNILYRLDMPQINTVAPQ
jgi:hypothetical protein